MSITKKLTAIAQNEPNVYKAGLNAMITRSLTKISSHTDAIGAHAFYFYTALTDVDFPNVETVGASAFYGCTGLTVIDWPSASSIGGSAFRNCSNLNTLILRKTVSVCTLNNVNAFTGTPFASDGAGGTVYVPEALVASYQTAANWSALNCSFAAIEGSAYE